MKQLSLYILIGFFTFTAQSAVNIPLSQISHSIHSISLNDNYLRLRVRNEAGEFMIFHEHIEDYLLGVLPAEMPASWPLEALKAQAVASRSYALAMKERRKHLDYDLEVTVMDQVFDMKVFKALSDEHKNKIRSAIESTRGEVIRADHNKAFKAYFHAHCGGQTRTSFEVWGVSGQNKVVKDESCSMDRRGKWDYSFSADVLKKKFFNSEVDGSIEIQSLDGEQVEIRIGEKMKRIAGDLFRKTMGYGKVKATAFQAELSDEKVHLHGRGYGHGVGMCQSGARYMAMSGNDYKKILERYYGHTPSETNELLASSKKAVYR